MIVRASCVDQVDRPVPQRGRDSSCVSSSVNRERNLRAGFAGHAGHRSVS
jgi:hypothetical protein